MTTELFEQQLREQAPAVHVLSDTIAEFLLNRGHAAKIGEIASQAGKRIGAGAKLIRETLAQNPSFTGEDRRWNLALRSQFHRPVEGAIQMTLRLFGKPMTAAAICNELAVLNARAPEYFMHFIPQFMGHRDQTYFQTLDGRWALVEWVLNTDVVDEDELLLRNFFHELDQVQPLLEQVREIPLAPESSYIDAALTLLDKINRPLPVKVISYALWRVQGDQFDGKECYLTLLDEADAGCCDGRLNLRGLMPDDDVNCRSRNNRRRSADYVHQQRRAADLMQHLGAV